MENNVKFISDDGTLASPELADQFQDIIEYVEKTPFKQLFPNKYKASIRHSVEIKTQGIFQEQPTMPLKNVVSTVLEDLDDDTVSAELILEMTQLITKNWERMTAAAYAHEPAEAMA
jgi:hypothetical protein